MATWNGIPDAVGVDGNGLLTDVRWLGGEQVVVHHDEVPEIDMTMVRGIPCTTALRTVIDIAPDVDRARLESIVDDCLRRRLFTLDEAAARLARADMRTRPGAELLRAVLRSRGVRIV